VAFSGLCPFSAVLIILVSTKCWCFCSFLEPVGIESKSVLKKCVIRPVVEEASCHACEKLSTGERVYWEVVFSQRESSTIYKALRIVDMACCRDPEREAKN